MNNKIAWKERLTFFFLGAAGLVFLMLLTGATDYANSSLNFGRYQLSSWATQLSEDGGVVGAFVMDTVSGETKTVYIRTYGTPGRGKVVKNNLKKSFSAIK